MQEQITQLHLEILALCFAVKAKGHDAFYRYYPHVNSSDVDVRVGGWRESELSNVKFDSIPTVINEYYCGEHTIKRLTECKEYFEGLLDD